MIPWLKYQLDYINDKHPFIICEKSVRIGMTFATAAKLVMDRTVEDVKLDAFYLSATYKQAREFISYCSKFNDIVSLIANSSQAQKVKQDEIVFNNGSRIVAMSSRPESLRGVGGDIILDEFAFHLQQEELFKAAQGRIKWGGQLRILSSHNGYGTYFNQLAQKSEGKVNWGKHKISLIEAANQGLYKVMPGNFKSPEELINKIHNDCDSEHTWEQEYLCIPTSAGSSIINFDLYNQLANVNLSYSLPEDADNLYVGIDVGRFHDLTVIWILQEKGEMLETVLVDTIKNRSIPDQVQWLKQYLDHPNIKEVAIDKTGIGQGLADELENMYNFITPIQFTVKSKKEIIENLRRTANNGRISLPLDDKIREDITAMQTVLTQSGLISYAGSTSFSHCDFFIALALANYIAKKTKVEVSFV